MPSFQQLAEILFPQPISDKLTENQANDVMHLIAHVYSDADYFVTNNTKDFIDGKGSKKNMNLKNLTRNRLEEIGIKILTSEEASIKFISLA
ncbi:MAG: hypothetical protein WKF85_12730 [Chitinophagaceae bacterium]